MTMRVIRTFAVILLMGALSACPDSNNETVTGKGSIRGIQAIPELGTVSFLIEETVLSDLNYKEASGTSEYDDLNYNFNFDILLPGEVDSTRLATANLTIDGETEYTFVLTGTLAEPEIIVWQQFGRDWEQEVADAEESDTEVTVMETSFGHVDADLRTVDVYLESPGTSPFAAIPRGTLSYGELQPAIELAAGEYQLIFTAEGDPGTILFASDAITLTAATSNLFAVMDDAGVTTGEFSVRWIGTSLGEELTDLFLESELSVAHAAFGTEPVDVVIGDDFSSPFISGLSFPGLSVSHVIDDGAANLIVTPAGNPGAFLAQKEINIEQGTYNRLFLVGLPGLLQTVMLSHDRRRLATHARVQLFQGAARFQSMDIYLVADDVDITLTGATYPSALFGSGTGYTAVEAGSYNLVFTQPGTKNIVGGPFRVELELARNYSIVIVDAQDITSADMLFFDDTPE